MIAPLKLGLLGGTFDPIHAGHLAMACAAHDQLQLDRVLLLPAGNPWQRQPLASAQQRLQMAHLATRAYPFLQVDGRETQRSGPTYTIDTLHQLREEYGPRAGLYLILGTDAFFNLPSWHHWPSLFDLCHIVLMARNAPNPPPAQWPTPLQDHGLRLRTQSPGSAGPELSGADCSAPAGLILSLSAPLHPATSTHIRSLLRQGQRTDQLLPKAVLDYIETHHLYQQGSDGTTTHQG